MDRSTKKQNDDASGAWNQQPPGACGYISGQGLGRRSMPARAGRLPIRLPGVRRRLGLGALLLTGWSSLLIAAADPVQHKTGQNSASATTAGACCFADRTCVFTTEVECVQQAGVYQGDFVPCDPNPCLPSLGACCFRDSCVPMTQEDCTAAQGEFIGEDVVCDPIPCPTPTTMRSWGTLKAHFSDAS